MTLLMTLQELLVAPRIVILRGLPGTTAAWTEQLAQHNWPHTLILALEANVEGLPEALDKPVLPGVSAWICHRGRCLPPIQSCSGIAGGLFG